MNQQRLQAVPNATAQGEAPAAAEPVTVSAFEDFTNVTTFCKSLLNQLRLPEHVTAVRTQALFADLTAFLQARLDKEVEQKY